MIMNKRGEVPYYVVALALAVIVFFVSFGIFRTPASEAGTFFSSETLKAKDSKCLFDMQRAVERGINPTDTDKDGRPDACDICVNGKNDEDNDLDGMPTYCDKADNDRTIVACSRTVTKDGRCLG